MRTLKFLLGLAAIVLLSLSSAEVLSAGSDWATCTAGKCSCSVKDTGCTCGSAGETCTAACASGEESVCGTLPGDG